ncbi:hypothetical protein M2403_002039 [Rahnella sp. BIGb0603]|uniref:hypothetical protein n=1 Tax=Rahnella sp. BIGb0603 TaxID=2940612 RepID=UPI002168708E|nr:hypothetical protein [Rahnella sp. BIGb0603]MCS3423438.1 hypothetical protein [Rahnella sp. BIGb0603]
MTTETTAAATIETAASTTETPATQQTTESAAGTSLLGGDTTTTQAAEPFLAALPQEGDADGWNAVYTKLGRPETAEGYELPLPEGDTGEFAKQTSTWMHEAGLNKQQAQALATKWNAHQAQQAEALSAQREKQIGDDIASMKQEWGAKFDENASVIQKAVKTFAPPEFIEMIDKSGLVNNPAIAKMFLKIGSAISEDQLVSNQKGSPQSGEKSIADRLWG